MKTLSIPAIVMLLGFCQAAYAHASPQLADNPIPALSLQTALDQIRAFHKKPHRTDDFKLRRFVETEVMPHFSFSMMAHWIAGPYARHMTASDEAAFIVRLKTDFSEMLIKLLGNFDPDSNSIEIGNTRFTQADQAAVTVYISLQQRPSLVLSFHMQQIQQRWKIVDIQSNGLSLVMYYRARYINQLRGYGHLAQ
jgi:ABC-type transporter MlaC component